MPSRKLTKYEKRTRNVHRIYGKDAFIRWGKTGGNPILIEQGKRKRN